jgi:hypothetical protein
MKSNYTRFYKNLYRLFDGVTPLSADCGEICGGACCRGSEDTGMILFPGESTSLEVKQTHGRRYAICRGECDRLTRPLSCRIFPFFPMLTDDGEIRVTADPRGRSICPLVRNAPNIAFDTSFIRRVYVAGRALSRQPECRELLREITAEINDIFMLSAKIGGEKDEL